jgi:hypothetical protein
MPPATECPALKVCAIKTGKGDHIILFGCMFQTQNYSAVIEMVLGEVGTEIYPSQSTYLSQ